MINRIRELFHYDPATGIFTRKIKTAPSTKVGEIAGYVRCDGYVLIKVDKKNIYAHRLAWLCFYGASAEKQIDHINGIKSDNRIVNLRLATLSQNQHNRTAYANNTSGYKGVMLDVSGKWMARIKLNGKSHYLGTFDAPADAHAAYIEAATRMHGPFCNTNSAAE